MKFNKVVLLILAIGIIIRIYGINNPPYDQHHWRQTDTASIINNYYNNGMKMFYPEINWSGTAPGYVETEFQIYSYIVAILYKIFGTKEIIGRFVSISFFILSFIILYKMIIAYFNKEIALYAVFFFTFTPLNIIFSRTIMPESMMLFCSIAVIYYYSMWLENNNYKDYFMGIICGMLAILIKIPTLYLGFPLLFLTIWKYKWKFVKNIHVWIFSIFMLVPSVIWYYHSHQLLIQFGNTFSIWDIGGDKWGNIQWWTDSTLYITLAKRFIKHLSSFIGIILVVAGIFTKLNNKQNVFKIWLLALLFYSFIIAKGNIDHEYYQVPYIPVFSIFMAISLYGIRNNKNELNIFYKYITKYRRTIYYVFVVSIPVIALFIVFPTYEINEVLYKSGEIITETVPKNSILLVCYKMPWHPEAYYSASCHGWTVYQDISPEEIKNYIRKGATHFVLIYEKNVLNKENIQRYLKSGDYILNNYPLLFIDDNYAIFKLTL